MLFCAAFTVKVAAGLSAPFGFDPVTSSVDAYNGATWSTGARALRESGPIDSKFGAVWSGTARDYRYADHPPLIYSATALAQWVVPDDELGGRLLVFVASILAAVILFLLLRELGLAPVLAAASVGVGLSVPMFLTYGTMLDTLMLGLPLAAWYLLLWQRSLNGRTSYVGLASAAAGVSLVAWEGVILVAATALVTVAMRRDRERLRAIAVAGLGAAAAVVVTVLWQVWVYGGLTEVLDQAAVRAGGAFTLSEYFHRQWSSTREMFGIPAFAVLGAGVVALLFESPIPSGRTGCTWDVHRIRNRISGGVLRPRLLELLDGHHPRARYRGNRLASEPAPPARVAARGRSAGNRVGPVRLSRRDTRGESSKRRRASSADENPD